MEEHKQNKAPLTVGQKRLLGLVYGLGGVLILMFVFVMAGLIYQVAHLK
jgi:hypothetical protein